MGKWRWGEVNRTDFREQLRMERMLTKERKHSKKSKKKKRIQRVKSKARLLEVEWMVMFR